MKKLMLVCAALLALATGAPAMAAQQVAMITSANGACEGIWRSYQTVGSEYRIAGDKQPLKVSFAGKTLSYEQDGGSFTSKMVAPNPTRLRHAINFFENFVFEDPKWTARVQAALEKPQVISVTTNQATARHEFFLRHDRGFFIAVFVEGDADPTKPRYWMMLAKGGCHPDLGATEVADATD